MFSTVATCAVLHHMTAPEFYEEVKLCLPAEVTDRHHLYITFYHVSCESSVRLSRQSIRGSVDTLVGYAWLPLMRSKRCDTVSFRLNFYLWRL